MSARGQVSEVRYEKFSPDGHNWHEYANLFPMMSPGPEMDAFEADIEQGGVLEPIVFYEGKVLDGRNRFMAARKFHQEYPRVDYLGDDPLGFVVSLNLKRRHLSESQRAMVASNLAKLPAHRPADKSANLPTSVSQTVAAEMLNVSERSVRTARTVQEQGVPELVAAVESGSLSVHAAADVATLPVTEQLAIIAENNPKALLNAAKGVRGKRVEKKRAEKVEQAKAISARNAEIPESDRKYGVIYADPPWKYTVWGGAGTDRAAENHYPTMELAGIKGLPVERLAADDCALFLWAVMPQLPDAFDVIKAWGFEFKTVAFVWVKTTKDEERPATGMGYWTRANAEICILATRGNPVRLNADVSQVVQTPRREHSRKPDEVAARIERLVPGPYIELFSRRPREGWDMWGNQADSESEVA